MASSAVRYEGAPGSPPWGDVKQAVMDRAQAVADAVAALLARGAGRDEVRAAEEAVLAFRDAAACMRYPMLDEAVIEAHRRRAAADALAAAGLVPPQSPPQRPRHLHVVS